MSYTVRRQPGRPAADRAAEEALRFLTPDLTDFLGDLSGASVSIATAAVQLLPFGSRAALVATGLATSAGADHRTDRRADRRAGVDGCGELALTPLAFTVMAAAAEAHAGDEIGELADVATALAAARGRAS